MSVLSYCSSPVLASTTGNYCSSTTTGRIPDESYSPSAACGATAPMAACTRCSTGICTRCGCCRIPRRGVVACHVSRRGSGRSSATPLRWIWALVSWRTLRVCSAIFARWPSWGNCGATASRGICGARIGVLGSLCWEVGVSWMGVDVRVSRTGNWRECAGFGRAGTWGPSIRVG